MKEKKKPQLIPSKLSKKQIAYGLTAISIALYVATNHLLFALATFALLIYVFYEEFFTQKNALKELVYSLGFALGAWLLLSFLLNTSSPINVVTSCSMLPNLERGDLIILQGGELNTQAAGLDKNLSQLEYRQFYLNNQQTGSRITLPFIDNQSLFSIQAKECNRVYKDRQTPTICLDSINLQGVNYSQKPSHDTMVFESDTSAGLIIHRSLLKMNATDGEYYLTKGDNNQFPDQLSGFPVIKRQEMRQVLLNIPLIGIVGLNQNASIIYSKENDLKVKGKVLLRVPYIGYAKLFLFLQFATPAGCDSTLQ